MTTKRTSQRERARARDGIHVKLIVLVLLSFERPARAVTGHELGVVKQAIANNHFEKGKEKNRFFSSLSSQLYSDTLSLAPVDVISVFPRGVNSHVTVTCHSSS